MCRSQSKNRFCVSKGKIANGILGDFACPASTTRCPSKYSDVLVEIGERGRQYQRQHTWNTEVPTDQAYSWNCKYIIRAKRSLVSQEDVSKRGYIMLQVEQYGFDDEVFLIVQRHERFDDFSLGNQDGVTKIYKVNFSNQFYIPAEYDLLLSFRPVRRANRVKSKSGKIKLRTWLQDNVGADEFRKNNVRVQARPSQFQNQDPQPK